MLVGSLLLTKQPGEADTSVAKLKLRLQLFFVGNELPTYGASEIGISNLYAVPPGHPLSWVWDWTRGSGLDAQR